MSRKNCTQQTNLSFKTAKTVLLELLTDTNLRKDVEIVSCLEEIVNQHKEMDKNCGYSRIHIDSEFRIFFPDYGNRELKMAFLPKTVYLFFLLNPKGVVLKNMFDYYDELHSIYLVVSKTRNIEAAKIKKSLENVVDPTNNRIHEICSIIRKSLLEFVPHELISDYTITGKRGDVHSIRLERSLIEIERINQNFK
ncbi:hypothetical protein [uncultured Bacteroides sp.]|uniref:hypothetical protein n=1 Tax=uncultured Bacteroides sp. TaxID=162156 RepID=UPI002620F773|nr:hypothetical protein [uncultured Bacteroides sp.]